MFTAISEYRSRLQIPQSLSKPLVYTGQTRTGIYATTHSGVIIRGHKRLTKIDYISETSWDAAHQAKSCLKCEILLMRTIDTRLKMYTRNELNIRNEENDEIHDGARWVV